MFRVFSKFNALFVRPKIRGAIAEYQTQLIDTVKDDIAKLQDRFKQQYGHSQAHSMSQLHDIPPISGSIIWARQIENQLDGYMKRVEDVLGTQWALHAEGKRLRDDSVNFRKKLDTRPVYTTWVNDVNRRHISISGRLFRINRNRASGNSLELAVNFDAQVITLFKEVRNLQWLSFSIPHAISNVSKEARRVYPYAVSLMESVRAFVQTCQIIANMADVALLLHGYRDDVQKLIAKGVPLKWETFVHAYEVHIRTDDNDSSSVSSVSSSSATIGRRCEPLTGVPRPRCEPLIDVLPAPGRLEFLPLRVTVGASPSLSSDPSLSLSSVSSDRSVVPVFCRLRRSSFSGICLNKANRRIFSAS